MEFEKSTERHFSLDASNTVEHYEGCTCIDGICGEQCPCQSGTLARFLASLADGTPDNANTSSASSNGPRPSDAPVFACSNDCSCTQCPSFALSPPSSGISGDEDGSRQEGLSYKVVDLGPKGHGVVSRCDIPAGTVICEYVGEVITEGEAHVRRAAQEKIRTSSDSDTPIANYILQCNEVSAGDGSSPRKAVATIIDATEVGGDARFVNHSCEPNCMLVPVRRDCNVPYLYIMTASVIASGVELTLDYGVGSDVLSQTPCLCQAQHCRGWLPG